MNKSMLLPIGILLLAALAGCGDEGGSTKKSEPKPEAKLIGNMEGQSPMDIFPDTVGTQVTYELQAEGDRRDLTFVVKDVQESNGVKDITMDVTNAEGEVTDTTVWTVSDAGIAQKIAKTDQEFNPPQMLLHFPIVYSENVDYEGEGPFAASPDPNARGQITGTNRVRGTEIVQTQMGEIEAIAIESAYTWESEDIAHLSQETSWVSPKYGIVRYQQTLARRNAEGQGDTRSLTLILKGYSDKG